jgi:two-component system, sensor histidine kinase RpfC
MPGTRRAQGDDRVVADRQGEARPRVLIVDDHSLTARALATLLDSAGFVSTVCHRGSDALARARDSRFEAAIVDVHLPDLSGLIVSQKLRERLGDDAAVLVLSGDTSMQTLNSLSHCGASYFFSKPVNAGRLLNWLRGWRAARA